MPARVLLLSCARAYSGAERVLDCLAAATRESSVIASPNAEWIQAVRDRGDDGTLLRWCRDSGRRRSPVLGYLRLVFLLVLGGIELSRLIRRLGISLVHANNLNAGIFAVVALALRGSPRLRLVFHVHDIFPPRSIEAFATRIVARRACRVIAVSNSVRDSLVALGVPPANLVVIHEFIDDDWFTPREDLAARPGQADYLVCVGKRERRKGHDLLLEAWNLVPADARKDIALRLVGPDDTDDPAWTRKLAALASKPAVAGSVSLQGPVASAREIMQHAIALVHSPAAPDPCPLVIIEAMAVGIPVISVPLGGVPEIVQHGVTGWLAQNTSANALAVTIEFALRHRAEFGPMGARGRDRAKREFSASARLPDVQMVWGECSAL